MLAELIVVRQCILSNLLILIKCFFVDLPLIIAEEPLRLALRVNRAGYGPRLDHHGLILLQWCCHSLGFLTVGAVWYLVLWSCAFSIRGIFT